MEDEDGRSGHGERPAGLELIQPTVPGPCFSTSSAIPPPSLGTPEVYVSILVEVHP